MKSVLSVFRALGSASVFALLLSASGTFAVRSAIAQTAPIALPSTISTLAGGATAATTAGASCTTGSPYLATDAYGDGCPGSFANFGTDGRGGLVVDGEGNVFVGDVTHDTIRVISGRSGIVNRLAGGGTACGTANGQQDKFGDGCPSAQTTGFNSPRGVGIDPYGNIFNAGYNDDVINVICTAASPLCPNTAGGKMVGSMYRIAGCVAGTTVGGTSTSGTTAGSSGDGTVASPYGNLAADVAAWGAGSTAYGTCSATSGGVNSARGVTADRYGNVYIADTGNNRYRVVVGPASYNGVTNPLAAILALNPSYSGLTAATAAGRIYPILGGFTAPSAVGAACAGTGGGSALDADGDGCPFYQTLAGSGAQGIAVDSYGNIIFGDNGSTLLRVLYVGGAAMANAITVSNPSVTSPVAGSVYVLAGGGTTGVGASPAKGTSISLDSNIFKVTVGANGNIFIGDGSQVLFFDVSTGYIRKLFAAGAPCTSALDSIGDGCPASQASWSGGSGLGVGLDSMGNLYITDTETSTLVRKISAASLVPIATGSSLTQTVVLHGAPGTTGMTASLAATSPDITSGSVACGAAAADGTMDCTVPVTFAPKMPGQRSAQLLVNASGSSSSTETLALAGTASGPAMAVDSSATGTTTLGSGIAPISVAVDGASNLYTMDATSGKLLSISSANGTAQLPGSIPAGASQIAVDAAGNVYAVGTGSSSITKLTLTAPGTYTAGTISYAPPTSPAAPQAIAVDGAGNLYVADKTNLAVYEIPAGTASVPSQPLTTVATGLTNPVALALDGEGDLFIADQGAGAVIKVSGATGAQTTVLSGIVPVGIAADAAGDVYVQDGGTDSVIEVPVTGPETTVLTGLTAPTGLAVDGNGVLYSADSHAGGIVEVLRSQTAYDFGTSITTTFNGTVTNAGNAAATGFSQTDTSDFQLASAGANGCPLASGSVAAGEACTVSATFTPSSSGNGAVSDALALTPAASSIGSLTLSGTKTGTTVTTTTAISGQTPASPIFSASGTEVSFTVTVTPSSGSVSGTSVQVSVDGGSAQAYTLSGTTATVALTGLSAGSHSITATYPTQAGIVGSTSSAAAFSIAQAATAVTWTPAATTQSFSQAIGAGVLDASAGGLAGFYTYTATPSSGASFPIDASAYLPVGTYSLAVTFTPEDSLDYTPSTAGVGSYTVTKASTTAAVGATQNVVAQDGTGNYTSVQAAVNALSPTAGGSIYIKPGTYTGFVTINTPFVSLRGLGGNPSSVVITNEDGAFSAPFLPGQGTGNNGSQGDQGSSTMVVAKGSVNGTTYIPNAFYMENLSVANTYDTDATNSNTNALVGGVCTAGQAASNNQALYNAGALCNSQALALWITSDQAVLNNVQLSSLQDTLYAGSQGCGATCTAARQYFWKGRINGDVDYIFGDAAMVFDHTVFYSAYHGSATGTVTIEAQNKKAQTGSASDYLSGYVLNNAYLLSQSSGMSSLYYGRPYGQYSTYIMLNSYVDQVNPTGWIEFSNDNNLPTSTYAEYNTMPYTDPSTGTADPNGFLYAGTGGSSGAGVAGPRETVSTSPGTPEAANAVKTSLTAAQASIYSPVAFLSTTVPTPSPSFTGFQANWDPTAALAADANAFVPSGSSLTINAGSSVTILARPETPGAGTIPTGTYTISDGGTVIASGALDATGEAYLTTNTLTPGTHSITTTYSGDANFSASSSSTPYTIKVVALESTATSLSASTTQTTPGQNVTLTATVTSPGGTPTGTVTFTAGSTTLGIATLSGNTASLNTASIPTGVNLITGTYSGDSNFSSSTGSVTVTVASQFSFSAASLAFGTQLDGASSSPQAVTITNNTGGAVSGFSVAASTGFTISNNTCSASLTSGQSCTLDVAFAPAIGQSGTISGTLTASGSSVSSVLALSGTAQEPSAPAVATGDTRTVVEPTFPAACQVLTASFHDVNEDVPASVEAVSTNLDQARLQSALNACTGTNQAVELSMDAAGDNSFLTGPITIPTGVTLLVDPGVTLYFSRNAQDYDTTQGVHTCGTVDAASNTASCQNLVTISNDNNTAIMGYGKLNGRGGDVVLNSFPSTGYESSTAGKTWWDLANDANTLGGSQQNPRGIQISKSTNITLYKITFKNPPNFHVAINTVNGLTVWDMKIVTPYSARNTDGIDPGNATNVTITNSWISDGDDNVAVGAPNAASANISVVNNHFFAGHGESIGSYTSGGITNVLYDHNQMYGDADVDGSNSTAIRIKSANDRGGVVQNIQYSNSCFVNHGTQIQFTPLYNTNSGTLTPNYKNILLQNLRFSNQGAVATGSVTFLGASNNGTVNPLIVTLDNVTIDTLASSNLIAPSNAQITLGPGQVSSTLTSLLLPYNGTNGNVITDNRTVPTLNAPDCTFTFLAPELTGPQGENQTVTAGQYPTAVVILTPAIASTKYPYPTGTVTLTDESGRTFTATLPGTTDTVFVPITNAPQGTHTYTASYSGDSNYAAITSFGSYTVTVNAGSLSSTTTALTGVPSATTFGAGFTAVASVAGSANPSGSVTFLVNGATYAAVPLAGGSASYTFNLPLGTYSISAVYSGDANNAGSTSSASSVAISQAATTTTLQSSATTGTVGTPVALTATVTSIAGTPTGSVSFSYTTSTNSTPTLIGNATLVNGVAINNALLPEGVDSVTATYAASGNFSGSSSTPPVTITVNPAPLVPVPASPVAIPYTISTIAGGAASSTCTGSTDSFGDGCQATSVQLSGTSADLRSVAADSLGNIYFTDAHAQLVRKIAPSGIVTNFAGYVSGSTCVPTATAGCAPTSVKLGGKPRGIYVDSNNNLFIAGYGDNKVQEVRASDGLMYLIAGTGSAPTNTTDNAGDGGAATSALMKGPRGVWTDAAGNIYIADSGDNRVREVLNPLSGATGAGNIQTIAGTGVNSSTGDGGLATAATLSNPQGVAVDANGNVYIAESSRVRAICVTCTSGTGLYQLLNKLGIASPVNGDIYTIAGTSTSGNSTLAPGLGNTVNMAPQKLALDADGNLYITDSANNVVWFEDGRTGYTRILAGGGTATSCAGSAIGDGCPATEAIIGSNGGNGFGLALDHQNNLYIADSTNFLIRKVSNNLSFAATAVGTPATQTVLLHFAPGDSPTSATIPASDFTIGTASCTVNSQDNTDDCTYALTFTPTNDGARSGQLAVATALGNPGTFALTGTGTGPVPGTVQLITTAVLSQNSNGSYTAIVTLTNNGTGTAQNVELTAATLGSASGTPLPAAVGDIAPDGGTATVTVNFPASAGAAGAAAAERYSGTYTGGSFGGSIRAKLP